MFWWKKKKKEQICGNCKLFDPEKEQCKIVVLHAGQKIHVPVFSEDKCFFEENYFVEKDEKTKFSEEIKEIKMWCEDSQGKPAEHGKIKIEFPKELDLEFDN